MSTDWDAIIIGAGHNSLACACHLAKRGWEGRGYEQNAVAGGAVKSGAYTKPGFIHDWAAMNLSLFAGGAFHTEKRRGTGRAWLGLCPNGQPLCDVVPRWALVGGVQ